MKKYFSTVMVIMLLVILVSSSTLLYIVNSTQIPVINSTNYLFLLKQKAEIGNIATTVLCISGLVSLVLIGIHELKGQ